MAQRKLLDSIQGFELSGHTFELHPYGKQSGTKYIFESRDDVTSITLSQIDTLDCTY